MEKFESEQSTKSRIQLLEDLLMNKFIAIQPRPNVIESAIQLIIENYGCCSIKAITEKLGISGRYLEKNFKRMVGIPPTIYKRMVKFNFMLGEIKADTTIDYQLLSAQCSTITIFRISPRISKNIVWVSPTKFHVAKFNFLKELMASKALLTKYQQNRT